jgi:hypothetical protein
MIDRVGVWHRFTYVLDLDGYRVEMIEQPSGEQT